VSNLDGRKLADECARLAPEAQGQAADHYTRAGH